MPNSPLRDIFMAQWESPAIARSCMELTDRLYHACRDPKRRRLNAGGVAAVPSSTKTACQQNAWDEVIEDDVDDNLVEKVKYTRRSFIISKENELAKRAIEEREKNTKAGAKGPRKGHMYCMVTLCIPSYFYNR
jgi:hypothetical protein